MNNNPAITSANSTSVCVETRLELASLITEDDKKRRICETLTVQIFVLTW